MFCILEAVKRLANGKTKSSTVILWSARQRQALSIELNQLRQRLSQAKAEKRRLQQSPAVVTQLSAELATKEDELATERHRVVHLEKLVSGQQDFISHLKDDLKTLRDRSRGIRMCRAILCWMMA